MYLRAKGGPFTSNLVNEILAITDRATLDCKLIAYDRETHTLSMPIIRFPIIDRRRLLGRLTPYARDMCLPIKSLVTIHNVQDYRYSNETAGCGAQLVTLIFGITIADGKVVASSVEESKGKTVFSISVTTQELDIEIQDV